MIILKPLIHDVPTNFVEATWVDRIQLPDIDVPESFGPTTRGEDGAIVPGELIPAHVVKGGLQDTQVKCHSYADVQMDMLRADAVELGTDLSAHDALIALVESRIVPYVAPPVIPIDPKLVLLAQLESLDVTRIRPLAEGDMVYLAVLNKQAVDLRAKLQGLK